MKRTHYLLVAAGGLWLGTAASLYAQPYTFGTLAGNPLILNPGGQPEGAWADGTNRAARFNSPNAVAADGAGNILVADALNNTIRKLTGEGSNWVVTTVAGAGPNNYGSSDGTNRNARFNAPQGVAVDSGGNLYVADMGNKTIRKISTVGSDWVVSTIAGLAPAPGTNDGIGADARFSAPVSVAVDSATNLYVADATAHTIRMLKPAGTNWVVTTIAGLPGASGAADGTNSDARLYAPRSVAVDNAGHVYVADGNNSTIRELTPAGTNWVVTTIAGMAGQADIIDGANSNARFSYPSGVAVATNGNLYVADDQTIRKVTRLGTNWVVTTIGGVANSSGGYADGTGSNAQFRYPGGVTVDSAGKLYVADTDNQAIRQGAVATLQISRVGDQVILTWPLGLLLEATHATGPWITNLTATAPSYQVSPTGPRKFYRIQF